MLLKPLAEALAFVHAGHIPALLGVLAVDTANHLDVTGQIDHPVQIPFGATLTAPILLTGGTGTLGRAVTPLLQQAGCQLRVLSRQRRQDGDGIDFVVGDLATGAGVASAVDGITTIVHCAGTAKGDDAKARHLVDAATRAATTHLVFISVVGADRVPVRSAIDRAQFGYFAAKRGAERVIEESGLPWTTLRAAQFYDGMLKVVQAMAKIPVIPVPAVRFQPIATGEVAARLVHLALGQPAGLVPDMAGPRVYSMKELVRSYLHAAGKHRLIMPIRAPGKAARAIRLGANLAPGQAVGKQTWEQFLHAELSTRRQSETARS